MDEDGYTFQTYALAAHGLAALQPGTVEVLGVLPVDVANIKKASVHTLWRDFRAWSLQGEQRANCPIPVFYPACRGHSTFVAPIEKMCAPL
eukprot:5022262-Pyramimonas_sp.AAC.1